MNMTRHLTATASLVLVLGFHVAHAAPGAHGPNGEHLDAPSAGATGSAAPRIEAKSEAFELVGLLQGGELSILINRFETNEPVLGATVEVESGNLKARAPFHADHGDYAVADASFVAALGKPGSHPLVITITAGTEADLLEGTLAVPDAGHLDDHGLGALGWQAWAAGGVGALLVAAATLGVARRGRASTLPSAGSAA